MSNLGKGKRSFRRRDVLLCIPAGLFTGCARGRNEVPPAIRFTRIPQADVSGREKNEIVEGNVVGGTPDEKIVLYARNQKWWIQPLADRPVTPIGPTGHWTNATHLGTDYAAMLVKQGYQPQLSCDELPQAGGDVIAVTTVKGAANPPSAYLSFSGYEWRVRDAPSARGGNNLYKPSNAWVDDEGSLHLQVTKSAGRWTCAEVSCTRSLGYGTYSFIVRDSSRMEPSAALDLFTYDYSGADENFHEMDIEISQWGDPDSKNAQYVVQPWYQAANVSRFSAPAGKLFYSLHWEHGRVLFQTSSLTQSGGRHLISEKAFTVGIPEPGIESIRMAFYVFVKGRVPLRKDAEVVIEKFEYLP